MLPAHEVFELARNNKEVHLSINGISDLFPGLTLSLEGHPFLSLFRPSRQRKSLEDVCV